MAAAPTRTVVIPHGKTVRVTCMLNLEEHARRCAAGMGALSSMEVLDALMGLPEGMPVPHAALTATERWAVQHAPTAVDRHGDQVVRRAVPPLAPQLAVITAPRWQVGLRAAGRLAPVCACAMRLPRRPSDWALAQANYWGVGVIVAAETLLEPAPYLPVRHTPAKWWFAEHLYQQITDHQTPADLGAATIGGLWL